MNAPGTPSSKDAAAMNTFLQEQLSLQRSREIILKITETCWDQCVSSSDSKTLTADDKACMKRCTERFLDTSVTTLVTQFCFVSFARVCYRISLSFAFMSHLSPPLRVRNLV